MTKLILTDVDETVLKFADPFQDWLKNTKGIEAPGRLRDIHNLEEWLHVGTNEALALLTEFGRTDILTHQPPEECAAEVLPQLFHRGYRFVAITACGVDPEFVNRRWCTLEATFGIPWDDVHAVELGASKSEYLSQYQDAIWVEDNFDHAVDGALRGHQSFLISRAYNLTDHHPAVTRVGCWRELHDLL